MSERKLKRSKQSYDKMKEELKKQVEDFKRGATYGSGMAVETANSLPPFVVSDDAKKKTLKSQRCPLIGCFGRNHSSSKSKACEYFGCKNKEDFDSKLEKYLRETYPEKYGEYSKKRSENTYGRTHIFTENTCILFTFMYYILDDSCTTNILSVIQPLINEILIFC